MRIAPSGYRRHTALLRDSSKGCARAKRDEILQPEIKRVWQVNMQVYGVPKVWRQMNREGIVVARCTVERLMRLQGLRGAVRGKRVRTTIADMSAPRPLDRVNRQFKADRPNQLWVSDFTYGTPSQRSPPAWGWRCLSMLGMQYPGEVDVGVCPSFAARGSEPKRR
ncbi:Transposase (plasmid) [Mycetohabitans rhizoxinica HKI 454]|uniref:Transposase n=1 Tax=Mycetohabitans rhizoxinica (strain DSM 19002 / CIP 109453 / HKI 454) TaxID=882378 RepID=E5AVT6_MYCRK|nr:Transposase [Mycetohabitans rhizoxinica HKI 454]